MSAVDGHWGWYVCGGSDTSNCMDMFVEVQRRLDCWLAQPPCCINVPTDALGAALMGWSGLLYWCLILIVLFIHQVPAWGSSKHWHLGWRGVIPSGQISYWCWCLLGWFWLYMRRCMAYLPVYMDTSTDISNISAISCSLPRALCSCFLVQAIP